jgi:hypothetical protein
MKNICSVIAISIILTTFFGCTIKPIMKIDNYPVSSQSDGSPQSQEAVMSAILRACSQRGWTARLVNSGLIEANILVRTHQAWVEIPFTASNYSIVYKNSSNLDYKKGDKIHRNYNRWVGNLANSIQRELGVKPR